MLNRKDGIEVASETMLNVGSESFSIPVDIGHRIDVLYNDDGWGQYHDYYITDNNGNVVFSSDEWGVPGDDPCNVYGLNPCEESPTCGLIEVTFTDGSQDCLLYTSPSPRDRQKSRMPSSA